MYQLLLGDEHDKALFERLCKAVARHGGTVTKREWGLGGSQEVAVFEINLPDGRLEAVAETYVGLSLIGPESVVARIAREVVK